MTYRLTLLSPGAEPVVLSGSLDFCELTARTFAAFPLYTIESTT